MRWLAMGVFAASMGWAAVGGAQQAVPTFHSLGLYWTPASPPANGECAVRYRAAGESEWRTGVPLWFDARNGECRGSQVHLAPATSYEVELSVAGSAETATLQASTWSEDFPVGNTVELADGVQGEPLVIDQGGTASGYALYTAPAGGSTTIDVDGQHDQCVLVDAPYVIVRGLELKNAARHGIVLGPSAHHVVIERNDISGWGRLETDASPPDNYWGQDYDAGVYCRDETDLGQVVVQRNRIHDPRSGANSWAEPRPAYGGDTHPIGPQAVSFLSCGGNNVFRYNDVYADAGYKHWFNDGFGGWSNFSTEGFPQSDSDIYGNRIANVWDDAIESEGGNANVRIWGNYLGESYVKVAIATTSVGPLYVWRNISGISRQRAGTDTDAIERGVFLKAGAPGGDPTGGRAYLMHNTMLQPAPTAPEVEPLGSGPGLGDWGGDIVELVSRNNIFHSATVFNTVYCSPCDGSNDFDFDMYSGGVSAYPGAESNGFSGTPTYDPANGPGDFALSPGTLGHGAATLLAGFNDGYVGAGPDVGAHEWGTPSMEFGVDAYGGAGGSSGSGGGAGAGASSGSGGGGGAGGQGSGANGSANPAEDDGGCGCRLAREDGSEAASPRLAPLVLIAIAGGVRRRKRRR